jgi:PTS system beta-glucosides-specific IIC component
MAIMIPITAFLLGPLGIWLGNGLGGGLAWLNTNAPIVFAIIIPLIYPFLVPLGLHWPLNALMLVNINTLGYDFIQGPMGAWNFACFGATAGVLVLSMRDKDTQMRQTATGALLAGLFGGISEPSLYGIHLRFKRIYPRMLVGCLTGGLIIGILGATSGGVKTSVFAFTSLLTIPVFNPMWIYAIAVAAAFFVAMALVIVSGYKDPVPAASTTSTPDSVTSEAIPAAAAEALTGVQVVIGAPVAGIVVPVTDVDDKVFASKTLGDGVGIQPTENQVFSPVAGTVATVTKTGHAFGIKTTTGVEVLVHIGIDTVQMKGDGFEVAVSKGQTVEKGDLLATVDFDKVRAAGFDTTTVVTVTNTKAMTAVTPITGETATVGAPIIDVTR